MMTIELADRSTRLKIANKVKFFHFNLGKGQITIAMHDEDIANLMDVDALIGGSFCSPEDNFNKRQGRHLALDRLLKRPSLLNLKIQDFEKSIIEPFKIIKNEEETLSLQGKAILAAHRLASAIIAERVEQNKHPEQVKWMDLGSLSPRGRIRRKKETCSE